MLEGKFLALTVAELKQRLAEHYKKVLVDHADEILKKGNELVPAAIMDGGVGSLDLEELVPASQDWFDDEHSDAEVVILFDEKTKEMTVIKSPYDEEIEEPDNVDPVK
jgi:hypothetical protein